MALITVVPPAERRILHSGDTGPDVKAYQRMLSRELRVLGYYPVNRQSGLYGAGTLSDTLRLQHAKRIVPNGRVGVHTWVAVDPQMHAYERWLLRKKPKPVAAPNSRIAHQMRVMLALGLSLYTQRRPAAVTIAFWRAWGGDCSGSGLLARSLAIPLEWDGNGNTQWIWEHGIPVDESDVVEGVFILYGDARTNWTKHTAVVSNLKSRLAIGFGSAPGREAPWRYRSDLMGFRRLA